MMMYRSPATWVMSPVTKMLVALFTPPVMKSELSLAYLKVLPVYRSVTGVELIDLEHSLVDLGR